MDGTSGPDKTYLTTIAIVFTIVITVVAVALRIIARRMKKIPLGADDYWIFVGAIATIANGFVFVVANQNGNGKHMKDLSQEQLVKYWKASYVAYQVYGVAITSIKLSVLCFYRRIFSTAQCQRPLYVTGILVLAWFISHNLAAVFECVPVLKFWYHDLPGHCFNPLAFCMGSQIPNIVLDVLILILPISAVLQLQMSTVKKISVSTIFLLGGLSTIIAILRLVVVINESPHDITYSTGKSSWSLVEPAVEVFSACLPTMAPFLRINQHTVKIWSIFRSLQHSSKSSKPMNASARAQCIEELNAKPLSPDQGGKITSTVRAMPSDPYMSDPDDLPLRSIAITEEIDWLEERC